MSYANEIVLDYLRRHADAPFGEQADLAISALNACETVADWQECIDQLGEREVGGYIADNADTAAFHPHESSGAACVYVDAETAVCVDWTDDGFYDVSFMPAADADAAIMALNEMYCDSEEA